MQKPFRIKIKVPGTSANLGPGFDIMGLALKIHNEFHFEFSEKSSFRTSLKNGKDLPFSQKDDLVYSSYHQYFQEFLPNENVIAYDVVMDLSLPLKGGLGSSASACVAGFTAANAIHKNFFRDNPLPDEKEILFHLAKLEGHPDNTTPAYLGGLVFAFFTEKDKLHYIKKKLPSNIQLFIFIPCYETDTNHSRKKLPQEYAAKDVIFNMARVGTWMEFIHTKKFKHLLLALGDRVHTPYRVKDDLILQSILDYTKEKNIGFALSGSGPTVLFFIDKKNAKNSAKNLENEIQKIAKTSNLSFQFFPIEPDNKGTIVKYA